MIYSWLALDYQISISMDPATGVLVGWLIAVKVESYTIRNLTAEVSTSFYSLHLLVGFGSLSIVFICAVKVADAV